MTSIKLFFCVFLLTLSGCSSFIVRHRYSIPKGDCSEFLAKLDRNVEIIVSNRDSIHMVGPPLIPLIPLPTNHLAVHVRQRGEKSDELKVDFTSWQISEDRRNWVSPRQEQDAILNHRAEFDIDSKDLYLRIDGIEIDGKRMAPKTAHLERSTERIYLPFVPEIMGPTPFSVLCDRRIDELGD